MPSANAILPDPYSQCPLAALCTALFAKDSDKESPDSANAHCLLPPACTQQHSTLAVLNPVPGTALSYCQLRDSPDGPEWLQGAANEIGRLAQGVSWHMPHGTDTVHFIRHDAMPPPRLRLSNEARPLYRRWRQSITPAM